MKEGNTEKHAGTKKAGKIAWAGLANGRRYRKILNARPGNTQRRGERHDGKDPRRLVGSGGG